MIYGIKKIGLIAGLGFFYAIAFAQLPLHSTGQITITQNINQEAMQNIRHIGFKFCNHGLTFNQLTNFLTLELRPGQTKEICTIFFNNSTTKAKIKFGFGSGEKINGAITCSNALSGNVIDDMIYKNYDNEFVLSGKQQLRKIFRIKAPKSYTGTIYGCIGYYLPENYVQKPGDLFGVIIRKVAPIEILITGDVYHFGRRDDIIYAYKDHQQTILKIIIAILVLRIVITLMQMTKKNSDEHKKQ